MNKNRRYTLFFLMLAVASISSGMGLKNVFEYSSTIGWGVGFVFFVISSYFACKLQRKSTN